MKYWRGYLLKYRQNHMLLDIINFGINIINNESIWFLIYFWSLHISIYNFHPLWKVIFVTSKCDYICNMSFFFQSSNTITLYTMEASVNINMFQHVFELWIAFNIIFTIKGRKSTLFSFVPKIASMVTPL
jgi:hypothetical protein